MSEHIDFQQLAAQLLARSYDLVSNWFPAGRKEGREWKIGNLRGDPGDSLSINLATGMWGDFAANLRGGDLISLYAAREGLSQLDAAKELTNGATAEVQHRNGELRAESTADPPTPDDVFEAPPPGQNFSGAHKRHGAPSATYVYRDAVGEVLYYVCRYETADGKQIVPWRWVSRPEALRGKPAGWRARHVPRPRPLYNLHRLAENPSAPVLLVEGEKCVEAASRLMRETIVTTWSGGSAHARYADYSPLAGRRVNIWPDADEPGWVAAAQIARILVELECTVGIVDTHGQPPGWDVADAIQEGWTLDQILKWAREHKRPIVKVVPQAKPEPVPEAAPERAQDIEPAPGPPPDEDTAAAGFYAQWRQYGLALDGSGRPHCNVDNVIRVINEHPGTWSHVWYDEFLQRIMSNADGKKGEWTDVHTLRLMLWFQRALGLAKLGSDIVHAAVTLYAHSKPRNEARDWLNGLTWDGTDRLPQLLSRGFGTVENAYTRAVGRCFIMGACQRVLVPGCKLDNMPVFEGEEGLFKSTALEILGGPYYTSAHEKVGEKDFYLALTGKMIVEIVEMHSFSGVAQERIKGVISSATDRYRAPYGRLAADHPRMSVFAGTTNEDDWNRSTTGARRFWPVACGKIDLAWIRNNREQLFAEACARLRRAEVWYDVDVKLARAEQVLRQERDAYEELLAPHLTRIEETTVPKLLDLIGIDDRSKWTPALQGRLSVVLRRAGFIPYRPRVDGVQIRAWRKRLPAEAASLPSDEPTPVSPDLRDF
jgi:putative DNA primase/helicase